MHVARLLSWSLVGAALSIFLYVGTNVAYTASGQADQLNLWQEKHPEATTPIETNAQVIPFKRPRLAVGQPLAKITIPAIQFSGVVLEGADSRVLSGGPGHVPATAYPGEADNMVISNHNTYSLSFGTLKAGDKFIIEADYGTFAYTVTGFRIVEANDKSVTQSTTRPTLTFTTCYPLWAGALAKQRYVITAVMQ